MREAQKYARRLDEKNDDIHQAFDKIIGSVPKKREQVAQVILLVEGLLSHKNATELVETASAKNRAYNRALEKKAPCHQNKNSIADATIIETYVDFCESVRPHKFESIYFVSDNTSDFSDASDERNPHPDLADIFASEKRKFSKNLGEVINAIQPETLPEPVVEWMGHGHVMGPKCHAGGIHVFDDNGYYGRSQYGGLTWQLRCTKCGAYYDTGEYWD